MKRIFLLAHFPNDHEEMLGPYSSMYEAVDQQSSYGKGQRYDIEYSCCIELFRTRHAWCTFDLTEDFIEEWCKRDDRGPRMREPSKQKLMEAAE